MRMIRPLANLRRVYCAGPLFNAAERQEMMQISAVLSAAGFEPFVPHADGVEFAQVLPYLVSQGHDLQTVGETLHRAVFALDVYQVLVGCGALVFNMNGRIPDEGGVAELSMAWMVGKPVVLFKEDARSAIAGRDNPLVIGQGGFESIDRLELLAETLSAQIGCHPLGDDWQVPCPPQVESWLTAGERFWGQLQSLGAARPVDVVAQWMVDLFLPEPTALAQRPARA